MGLVKRRGRLLTKGFKIKFTYIFVLLIVWIVADYVSNFEEQTIPHHPLLYSYESAAPSVLTKTVKDIKFVTAIDSIYESKEYNDYIYTETDLMMAKEYRLYTTDKEKLFEKIFEEGNFEKSILIPIME